MANPLQRSAQLYDAAQHRELEGQPWSEREARATIEAIAADAIAAYRGPEQLWPNAPADLGQEPDRPLRNAYFGAAGVAWALALLASERLAPQLPGIAELAAALPDGFRAAPELVHLEAPPAPSLMFGESGVLLAVEEINASPGHRDELERCVRRNARHPSLELCWGSPGTMVAALRLWRRTGEERWREAWLGSARWLLAQWREDVWVQDLYGQQHKLTGAGHGFAGNAMALLAGSDLLDAAADDVMVRIAAALRRLAVERDGLVQWPPYAGVETERRPLQWCHGSPGILTSLAALAPDDETDRLLAAGGELIWRAGPLVKGPGLCHGTAGNAYAFLVLHARSGDERWLQRARAFSMDAAADVARRRAASGRGRYSLFTGDVGVALLLRSCLAADPTFPFLG